MTREMTIRKRHQGRGRGARAILLWVAASWVWMGAAFPCPAETGPGQDPVTAGLEASLSRLRDQFSLRPDEPAVIVDVSEQKLYLIKERKVLRSYPVSTSRYGTGSQKDSNKTPLGVHRIKEKIGKDAPLGALFRSRKRTGQIAPIYRDRTPMKEDLITTRILWLDGQEEGVNKGPGVDSHERYIYIHGTPEEGFIGTPRSHGCIRMRNRDVIELFGEVSEGRLVEIQE